MDEDGLPIVGAGVDYSKVDPIHQKRTLTFLNHFLVHTTSFLNHFATVCDEKLENLLIRIQRLEASMSILEAKLSSIPGLDDITLSSQASENVNEPPPPLAQTQDPDTPAAHPQTDVQSSDTAPAQSEPEQSVLKVSQDPRFAKYFKMVNLGVPVAAVKLKMSAEGVNADILDNPDAPAPPGAPSLTATDDEDSDDSDDSSD